MTDTKREEPGYVLVPVEPTDTQVRAGQLGVTTDCVRAIYAQMVATAPAAPVHDRLEGVDVRPDHQRLEIPVDAWKDFAVRFMRFVGEAPVSSGVCCCGDSLDGHADPMICGHSPVDQWTWVLLDWQQEFDALAALEKKALGR